MGPRGKAFYQSRSALPSAAPTQRTQLDLSSLFIGRCRAEVLRSVLCNTTHLYCCKILQKIICYVNSSPICKDSFKSAKHKISTMFSDQSLARMNQRTHQSQQSVKPKHVYLPSGLFVSYFTMVAVAGTKQYNKTFSPSQKSPFLLPFTHLRNFFSNIIGFSWW